MSDRQTYIKAILPLRLEWEPCYCVDDTVTGALCCGDRILVPFAGRSYHAVVSATGVIPEIQESRIQHVIKKEDELEKISEKELKFWRFISDYYMTPVGEIYKIAYPSTVVKTEKRKPKTPKPCGMPTGTARNPISDEQKASVRSILEFLSEGKTVLYESAHRIPAYMETVRRSSGTVLILAPRIDAHLSEKLRSAFGDEYVCFSSDLTAAGRRDLASGLRHGRRRIIYGTRLSLFLPFSDLSLIIVDEEQDRGHKQEQREPRLNVRDAAAMLSSIHGCPLLLGSSKPSLESLYNVRTGKYSLVCPQGVTSFDEEVIDTVSEKKKNGMCGSYSRKLLERISSCTAAKERILFLVPWKDTDELEIEARHLFESLGMGKVRYRFSSVFKESGTDLSHYGLVALLHAEYLSQKDDFRGDEKAAQAVADLRRRSGSGTLVIQTSSFEGGFSRDAESLLAERKTFGYPPFTRIIDVIFKDADSGRLRARKEELLGKLAGCDLYRIQVRDDRIRLLLPKDGNYSRARSFIRTCVGGFCSARRYENHLSLDVDPL